MQTLANKIDVLMLTGSASSFFPMAALNTTLFFSKPSTKSKSKKKEVNVLSLTLLGQNATEMGGGMHSNFMTSRCWLFLDDHLCIYSFLNLSEFKSQTRGTTASVIICKYLES